MKLIKFAVLAVWLFACGAPLAEDLEQLDLEQAELGVSVKDRDFGVRSDLAAPNEATVCESPAGAATIQACNYPSDKTVAIRCGSGFTAAELAVCKQLVDATVIAYNSDFSAQGWTYGRNDASGDCTINKGAVTGTSLTDIRQYISVTLGGVGASLTEPAGGYPGTFRKFTTLTATVDWAKILTNFAASPLAVQGHAVGNVITACSGLGATDAYGTNHKQAIKITPGVAKTASLDTIGKCLIRAYDPAGTSIAIAGDC